MPDTGFERQEKPDRGCTGAYETYDFVDGADPGDHPHFRIVAGKGGQPLRQEIRRDIAVHGDGDLLCRHRAQIGKRFGGHFGALQHVDGKGIDGLAGFGQARPAAPVAMKQRLAELRFERLDMRADRRLGDTERIGRDIEAAAIDDALEHAQSAGAGGDHRPQGLQPVRASYSQSAITI